MKKKLYHAVVFIAALVIAGCSTKFNVGAPYKNITVVYGFIDEADTAHYIRIEKAFLDQSKSAVTMAQTPDSSYYDSLNVIIKRINAITGAFTDTIMLNRVDLDLEGYPKQPGTFFTAPNYAYKFKNLLDPDYIYRLIISNSSTGEIDSADAPVIDDNNHSVFTIFQIDNAGSAVLGIDFATTGYYDQDFSLDGSYTPANGLPNPVAIVQAVITFNWYDSDVITNTLTPHSYDYSLGYENYYNGISYKPSNLNLYDAVFTSLNVAPPNIVRLMDVCNISVYASTNDYSAYLQAVATQGTGLTGSQIEPVYTNLKGANVIGLYTSRGVRTSKIIITADTIDSLIASPLLASVKIAGTIYH
jgi:hypothetical protein